MGTYESLSPYLIFGFTSQQMIMLTGVIGFFFRGQTSTLIIFVRVVSRRARDEVGENSDNKGDGG